ncbi:MAG TPA: hypothetical protein VJI15_04425 [Candidatus Nanoarchaeia archaeon]|nr:hypothetical protein [Candidatus Nanoarchaeia archaeon]
MEPSFQRFCAVKLSVKDIIEGNIHQQDESAGTYLLLNSMAIHRVNVIGVIVHKEIVGSVASLLIDDSTERIPVKVFEENRNAADLTTGNGLLVIGRVRIYNGEKYISPEILKKVPLHWLRVRMMELSLQKQEEKEDASTAAKLKKTIRSEEDKKDDRKKREELEIIEEEGDGEEQDTIQKILLPFQKILAVIKELDDGSGAMIEEVVERSPIKDTEQLLHKMLEKGDIFTLSPGRVKVL